MLSKQNVLKIHVVVFYKTKGSTCIATHLRCGGIYNDSVITNFLLIPTMKKI